MGLLADTHAHLDAAEFEEDLDEVIDRAQGEGIDRILAVGSDLPSSERAVAIAQTYDIVYAAVGIHPHESTKFDAEAQGVRALLREKKVAAVGEIGLDYVRSQGRVEQQMEAFMAQLSWARSLNLPVSVHNRGADTDIVGALRESSTSMILHCFSGGARIAEDALNMGAFLSFAGNLTFNKAEILREVARTVPSDRLLLETDSPVLAPQCRRGRRNEPAFLVETATALARLREVTVDTLARTTSSNADALFAWRTP